MGNTMPRSPDGSRSMVLGQEGGLQFEKLKERQAHQHDALQVRWQSGIHTKVPVCQRLSVRGCMLFLHSGCGYQSTLAAIAVIGQGCLHQSHRDIQREGQQISEAPFAEL